MKLKSLKNQLNNQKGWFYSGKIAKSLTTFRKNKPNLSEDKIGLKHFSTRIYERFHPLAGQKNKPNQTQYKANSNPICVKTIIGLSSFMTSKYVKFEDSAAKNKPKQSQNKPNFILEFIPECCSLDLQQGNVCSLGFLSGDKLVPECRGREALSIDT